MEMRLVQKFETEHSTVSELYVNGAFECYVLEDAVREVPGAPVEEWKVPGETAIPGGRYRVAVDWSTRFQKLLPHLLDVPGFEGIRMHTGNDAGDTEGCLLVGKYPMPEWLGGSREAWSAFYPKLRAALEAGEECWIAIERKVSRRDTAREAA